MNNNILMAAIGLAIAIAKSYSDKNNDKKNK